MIADHVMEHVIISDQSLWDHSVTIREVARRQALREIVRNVPARDVANMIYHAVVDERGNERYFTLLAKALAANTLLRPFRL
jgi:hypothetical protein